MNKLTEAENLNLPVPRLEIRYTDIDDRSGYQMESELRLVYQHIEGNVLATVLSTTKMGGSLSGYQERLDTPFRQGAEALFHMLTLRLPCYVIYGEKFRAMTLEPDDYNGYLINVIQGQGLKFKKPKKANK
jgi:hypothetical protein